MTPTTEKRTRYPGLASFTTAQKDLFFGRKQETRDLFNLISVERTVVLFSKSGYGKTSLLQAGVMPLLYGQWMVPVPVRFGTDALSPESHFSIQLDTAWHRFSGKTETEAQKAARDTSKDATFWQQIADRPFGDAPTQFTPLFIFDQFEELFTLYPDPHRREVFVQQLADLIHERTPAALRERVVADLDAGRIDDAEAARLEHAPPMRFVFSIRSDMLHFMDELSEAIPYILRSRYQLFGLNEAQARDAVLLPASLDGDDFASQPFGYDDEAMADIIGSLAKNREVESFQLQAVCQAIEEKIMKGGRQKFDPIQLLAKNRAGLPLINPGFYGGREGIDSIIEENYNKRLDSLADLDETWPDLARHILEDVLVNKNDRRQSVDVVELAAPGALLDELERQRLVRKEPRLDSFYFEISHDTWLPAIVKSRKIRQAAEEKLRLEKQAADDRRAREKAVAAQRRAWAVSIGAVLLAGFSVWQYVKATEAQKEAERLTGVSNSLLEQSKKDKAAIEIANQGLEKQKHDLQTSIDEMRRAQAAQQAAEQGKKALDLDRLLNEALTYAKAHELPNAEAKLKEAEDLHLPNSRDRIEAMRRQIQGISNPKKQ